MDQDKEKEHPELNLPLSENQPKRKSQSPNLRVKRRKQESLDLENITLPECCPEENVKLKSTQLTTPPKAKTILLGKTIDVTPKLDGGVLKTILKNGEADTMPSNDCTVTVHYICKSSEGEVIYSSYETDQPVVFQLGKGVCLKAWDIGFPTMCKGELARFVCQPQYAYDTVGNPPKIPPNATLIFDVEMLNWNQKCVSPEKHGTIVRTVIEKGEDDSISPTSSCLVDILLIGQYDGRTFENRNVTFSLGKGSAHSICEELENSILTFKVKEKSTIKIKSDYALGAEGIRKYEIPSNVLVDYTIQLNKVGKPLPTTDKSFAEMIRMNFVYIDKTPYLVKLIKADEKFFTMFRPRRFGKTVFLDTAEAYFTGQEHLFENLKISKLLPNGCEKYPVLRLDLSDFSNLTGEELKKSLNDYIKILARLHGVTLESSTYQMLFKELIITMAQKHEKKQIVILIDEAETPLRRYATGIENESYETIQTKEAQTRNIMKNFYSEIKICAKYIHFCLIFGITNLVVSDIFSGLNQTTPLDEFGNNFAAIVGFTDDEIRCNFDLHVKNFASQLNTTPEKVYEDIKSWYNGFRFTKSTELVYNPCSIIKYLNSNGENRSFFSQSGGSLYFDEQIMRNPDFTSSIFAQTINNCIKNDPCELGIEINESKLFGKVAATPNSVDAYAALFFQIGLLTIHEYESNSVKSSYKLKFSNLEYQSFYLETLSDKVAEQYTGFNGLIDELKKSVANEDWENFIALVNTFVSNFPHTLVNVEKSTESVFHILTWIILDKMGYIISFEHPSITGVPDLVATAKNRNTLILELKIETNSADALQQSKKYLQKCLKAKVNVFCLGILFCRQSRQIEKFGIAKYDEHGNCMAEIPYEWIKIVTVKLSSKTEIGRNTKIFQFQLPPKNCSLNVPIGKHLRLKANVDHKLMSQNYTPVSFSKKEHYVELVIEVCSSDKLSQFIDEMPIGNTIDCSGPYGEIQYLGCGEFEICEQFPVKICATKLAMIADGTGIIAMLRLIRFIKSNRKDKTEVSLIFANRNKDSILFLEELDKMRDERCKVWYTIDEPHKDWNYSTGVVTSEMITDHLPIPGSDPIVLMNGPRSLINSAWMPILQQLGYSSDRWFIY